MLPAELAQLLTLPAAERAELAIALWESLTDAQRDADLTVGPEIRAELDRRWAQHLADPDSATPWDDLRQKLRDGT